LHSEPLVYQYIKSSGTLTLAANTGIFQVAEHIRGSKGGFGTVQAVGGTSLDYFELKTPFTEGETITGLTSGATASIVAVPDVTMIYYGANDGMLHAVRDTNGTEAWGFIPPNQLARLKDMVESTSHQYYVDSSPKMYLHDINGNGFIDLADGDKVILVSGERKGSSGYFALDVTNPEAPFFLWRINRTNDTNDLAYPAPDHVISQLGESWSEPRFGKVKETMADFTQISYHSLTGHLVTGEQMVGQTSRAKATVGAIQTLSDSTGTLTLAPVAENSFSFKDHEIIEGVNSKATAKVTMGSPVFVVGGGYSSANATGKAVLIVNALTGQLVKIFENDADGGTNINGMDFSIPSAVKIMDSDRNGFIDKIYVGDMGGQVWRIGRFDKDELGLDIVFPKANENINDWQGQRLFAAGCNESSCIDGSDNNANGLIDELRRFFYPPTVTLEVDHDLVLIGSGDRENPCAWYTGDEVYAIRDNHSLLPLSVPQPAPWTRSDLTDITDPFVSLDPTQKGWLLRLASGEKVLAESTVFAGVLYFTTFTPNDDRCVPGGAATLYGVDYRTGAAGVFGTLRGIVLGGGIPSRPVMIISDTAAAMFVSVGSANPDDASPSTSAAILKPNIPPLGINLHPIWWKEGD
jgi:type IV pilus assembly protein PilY1